MDVVTVAVEVGVGVDVVAGASCLEQATKVSRVLRASDRAVTFKRKSSQQIERAAILAAKHRPAQGQAAVTRNYLVVRLAGLLVYVRAAVVLVVWRTATRARLAAGLRAG